MRRFVERLVKILHLRTPGTPVIGDCGAHRYGETQHYQRNRGKDVPEIWTPADSNAECGTQWYSWDDDKRLNLWECFQPRTKDGSKAPFKKWVADSFVPRTLDPPS